MAWCDETATPVLSCWWDGNANTWQPYDPNQDFCWCDPQGEPGPVYCAVPGFVGLERAGRVRKAPSLRAARRAA
jgi:hypothetical protein